MGSVPGRRRLRHLMVAGLTDSLCLSVAWTTLMLQVLATYGLAATGLCAAAMLVGVALSAPVAAGLARLLAGRQLLRATAGTEAVLRVSVFLLVFAHAPVWQLSLCIAVMSVTAWIGYAGMRAEVAAAGCGPTALTWYGSVVAAVEAGGVALAALLPAGTADGHQDTLQVVILAAYVLSLVPTAMVAGASPVPRSKPHSDTPRPPRLSDPTASGLVLMFAASGPTLLSVALAAQLHGRSSVALMAAAFILGSLAAPGLVAHIQARDANHATVWTLCAAGMVVGWVLAPAHVLLLCVAQLLSGLCMTALEGLLDTAAVTRQPGQVTGALARATAGRALGSAASTALLPMVVIWAGVPTTLGTATLALLTLSLLLHVARRSATAPTPVLPQSPRGHLTA